MELPRLEPLWNKYKERGLSVVVLEAARDTKRATKFIEENKLTYHLLETEEDNNVVADVYGIHYFPTSFLIDKQGRVIYSHMGFEAGDEDKIEKEILALLGGSDRANR